MHTPLSLSLSLSAEQRETRKKIYHKEKSRYQAAIKRKK
jgi:hypothetical protein